MFENCILYVGSTSNSFKGTQIESSSESPKYTTTDHSRCITHYNHHIRGLEEE